MYKDTAKWLLSFTPVTAVTTLALTLLPRTNAITDVGLCAWMRQFPIATTAVILTVLATAAVIVMCRHVLLAGASPWTDLLANQKWMSEAFSDDAVGLPLFPASTDFTAAYSRANTDTANPAEQTALAATTARILTRSENLNAKDRFTRFTWAYLICTVVIIGGLAVAAFRLPATPDAVTKPTTVSLLMPPEASTKFTEITGCTAPADDKPIAVAVAGMWDHPTLRLFGPGCTSSEQTLPNDLGIIVTPK